MDQSFILFLCVVVSGVVSVLMVNALCPRENRGIVKSWWSDIDEFEVTAPVNNDDVMKFVIKDRSRRKFNITIQRDSLFLDLLIKEFAKREDFAKAVLESQRRLFTGENE